MYAFGKAGFFGDDLIVLANWSRAILDLDKKIKSKNHIVKEKGKSIHLWNDLVEVCKKMNSKI